MSADQDVVYASAVSLLDRYRKRELSPVEVTRLLLDRLDALQPRINAFCIVDHDGEVVRGMAVGKGGKVIAMDVARDDMDLLVVTENGYGKRTQISQYRKTNRGAKGVKTIGLTEKKGGLAGALVVRDHHELVFISVGGMVQRTSAAGISQQGRSATGVRVMNLKDEDLVSAVALVVDAGDDAPAGADGASVEGSPGDTNDASANGAVDTPPGD